MGLPCESWSGLLPQTLHSRPGHSAYKQHPVACQTAGSVWQRGCFPPQSLERGEFPTEFSRTKLQEWSQDPNHGARQAIERAHTFTMTRVAPPTPKSQFRFERRTRKILPSPRILRSLYPNPITVAAPGGGRAVYILSRCLHLTTRVALPPIYFITRRC